MSMVKQCAFEEVFLRLGRSIREVLTCWRFKGGGRVFLGGCKVVGVLAAKVAYSMTLAKQLISVRKNVALYGCKTNASSPR